MTVEIGSRYTENLARIAGLINRNDGSVRCVTDIPIRDRCYYCHIPIRSSKPMIRVEERAPEGKTEIRYYFHKQCIDKLCGVSN